MAGNLGPVILYDSGGRPIAYGDGGALVSGATGLLIAASDGTNARHLVSKNSAPTTEYGVVVRNIPSGTQTVSGTVTGNQGTAAAAAGAWPVYLVDSAGKALSTADGAAVDANTRAVMVAGYDGTNAQFLSTDSSGRPVVAGAGTAGSAVGGVLTVQGVASMTPIQVTPGTSGTATHANVSASASNVTLLASNASRKGATIYNDSTAVLYVKLAATASSTSYTTQLLPNGYYEVPFAYTGIIDGIWAAANGAARVVEFT